MKQTKRILSVAVLALSWAALSPVANACTNFIVTKGASKSGSTMISYTADSHTLYGALVFRPSGKYALGERVPVQDWDSGRILGSIPQAFETYSVVGNMNEHQLLIGESTFGGLDQLRDTTAIIDYGTLMYSALQRCKTARQAIEYMGKLVADYGYASSGESISIGDPNEVWILEIISKGMKIVDGVNQNKGAVWVARRVPDGMVSAHANQARITTFPLNDPQNCIYSKDVISFARENDLYSGTDKDFDFSATYCPLDFSSMRGCESRVWSMFRQVTSPEQMDVYLDHVLGNNPKNRLPLWVKPTEKLDVKRVAHIMRDHFDGTPLDLHTDLGSGGNNCPYRWRPMTFTVDGVEYTNERSIATQQTGWWFVGECRSWLPDPIGGVLWFGVDDVATSPLTPIYCGTKRIPWCLDPSNGHMTKYSGDAMFWVANRISNFAYLRYDVIHSDIERAMHRFEDSCYNAQEQIDHNAVKLYKDSPSLAIEYITDYSVRTAQKLLATWLRLDEYLLVKFIDGNTKKEVSEGVFLDNGNGANIPAMPLMPGYNEAWKKSVANDTGDHLKVR